MLHIFTSWSHIIKSGLSCGTFVAVFTYTFHQYSCELPFHICSGSDESVIFLDGQNFLRWEFSNVFATLSCLRGRWCLEDIWKQPAITWLTSSTLVVHNLHLLLQSGFLRCLELFCMGNSWWLILGLGLEKDSLPVVT